MQGNIKRGWGRYQGGLIALTALGATFALWQVRELSALVYPFRLFVTLIHELGHGVSAALTGGRFVSLEVMSNGAGLATTAGGMRFIVIQAGYLSTALFGAVLLVLVQQVKVPRLITAGIGLFCGLVTLFLGAHIGTQAIGAIILAVFVTLALKGPVWLNAFVLNLLAMMVGLNAVMDIWWLVGSVDIYLGSTPNDALAMQTLTGVPASIWALLWVTISVLLLGWSVYTAFIRPLRVRNRHA